MKKLFFLIFLTGCIHKQEIIVEDLSFKETELVFIKDLKEEKFSKIDIKLLNPRKRDENQRTLIYYCISYKSKSCLNALIKANFKVNDMDVFNFSPLRFAVWTGWVEGAEVLLKNKAFVNDRSYLDNPIFFEALTNKDLEILKVLAKYRFNPNSKGFLNKKWSDFNFAKEFMTDYVNGFDEESQSLLNF